MRDPLLARETNDRQDADEMLGGWKFAVTDDLANPSP